MGFQMFGPKNSHRQPHLAWPGTAGGGGSCCSEHLEGPNAPQLCFGGHPSSLDAGIQLEDFPWQKDKVKPINKTAEPLFRLTALSCRLSDSERWGRVRPRCCCSCCSPLPRRAQGMALPALVGMVGWEAERSLCSRPDPYPLRGEAPPYPGLWGGRR